MMTATKRKTSLLEIFPWLFTLYQMSKTDRFETLGKHHISRLFVIFASLETGIVAESCIPSMPIYLTRIAYFNSLSFLTNSV